MARIVPDVLTDDDFPVEFGRYTLLGILGEGGMARVFRAELQGPEGFRKPAAVKIVRASIAAENERLRTSLINEARLGGLLHHPNVVDTYDFGEVEGLPYIAMEYVRGIGLERVLEAVRPLPPEIALEIGVQICAGLDHAHNLEDIDVAAELVHRDLKPSNVLVSRDGLVKVMDFGIAKATALSATNTATGMTKGTPSYMSPEQVNGETLDRRSDLFAMGTILYELFTGKRLFEADSLMSILMSVMQVEERLEASGALDELDLLAFGLADVVRGCLRRHPVDRWADAAELEYQLKLLVREMAPPPPLKRWVRALMETAGIGIGEASISMTPPARAGAGRTPVTLPTGPQRQVAAAPPIAPSRSRARAAAPPPAPSDVGATRPQVSAVPSTWQMPGPVPAAPPPTTDPKTPAPVPDQGTLWMDEDEEDERRSPLLLLLLGLLFGGVLMAVVVIGVIVVLGELDEPKYADAPTADPDLPVDLAIADAGETAPDSAPTPRPTTSRPRNPGAATPAARPEPTVEPPTEDDAVVALDPHPDDGSDEDLSVREAVVEEPAERPTPRRSEPDDKPTDLRTGSSRTGEEPATAASEPELDERRSGRFRLRAATAKISERTDDGIRVRFRVEPWGPCEDPSVSLHYNPPGAKWVAKPMRGREDGSFGVNILFKPKNQGRTYYYVSAKCPTGEKATSGRDKKPLRIDVK